MYEGMIKVKLENLSLRLSKKIGAKPCLQRRAVSHKPLWKSWAEMQCHTSVVMLM